MESFSELVVAEKYVKFRQDRAYVLCLLRLPDEVRERTPQSEVAKAHGDFLLGFSSFPTEGFMFPYGGQIWRISRPLLQFPTRYKSREKKHPAIAVCEHVGSYQNLDEAVRFLLQEG